MVSPIDSDEEMEIDSFETIVENLRRLLKTQEIMAGVLTLNLEVLNKMDTDLTEIKTKLSEKSRHEKIQ